MGQSKYEKPENELILIRAVANNVSISGVCRELGLRARGGNITTIRRHIVRLELDTSHHTGQGWNKENYRDAYNGATSALWKKTLLRERGHVCWTCSNTEWTGQPIPLELDHIDGNNKNNERENLRILCCNCHALTPTFRNKARPSG